MVILIWIEVIWKIMRIIVISILLMRGVRVVSIGAVIVIVVSVVGMIENVISGRGIVDWGVHLGVLLF